MNNRSERREFTRVLVGINADLRFSELSLQNGKLRDMSLKGVFFLHDQKDVALGSDCTVTINLGDSAGQCIKALGSLARVEDEGLGIEFTHMDYDSFVHLQNFMLANSGPESDAVKREIMEHIGLTKLEP
jgi:hypothetical protein